MVGDAAGVGRDENEPDVVQRERVQARPVAAEQPYAEVVRRRCHQTDQHIAEATQCDRDRRWWLPGDLKEREQGSEVDPVCAGEGESQAAAFAQQRSRCSAWPELR